MLPTDTRTGTCRLHDPLESLSHGAGVHATWPSTDNPHESCSLQVPSGPSSIRDSANQEDAQEQKELERSKKDEMRHMINKQSGILALLLRLGFPSPDNPVKHSDNTALSARYEQVPEGH